MIQRTTTLGMMRYGLSSRSKDKIVALYEGGANIADIKRGLPNVSKNQVSAVLREAGVKLRREPKK